MSLSPDERYFRFFGGSEANIDDWLTKITTTGPIEHLVFLVLNGEQVVAIADVAHSKHKAIPEIAISVDKSVRKLLVSVGREPNTLVEKPKGKKFTEWFVSTLLDIAKDFKFPGVQYSTMSDNIPMLNLGRKLGFTHKWVEGAVTGEMSFQGDDL